MYKNRVKKTENFLKFEFSAEFLPSKDIKEHKFQKYLCHSISIHTHVLPTNKQYYMRKNTVKV